MAVGKGASSESATRGMLENAAAAFVATATLLIAITVSIGETNANLKEYAGQTKADMKEYAGQTNTKIEKLSGETNLKIEKLSSETKAGMVALRHEFRDDIRDLDKNIDKNMNTKVDMQTRNLLFAMIGIAAAPLVLSMLGWKPPTTPTTPTTPPPTSS